MNKGISPHFVYYLGTQKVSNKSKSLKMLNLKIDDVAIFIVNSIQKLSVILISIIELKKFGVT